MLQPARRKYRKEQKGRNTGKATRGNKVRAAQLLELPRVLELARPAPGRETSGLCALPHGSWRASRTITGDLPQLSWRAKVSLPRCSSLRELPLVRHALAMTEE